MLFSSVGLHANIHLCGNDTAITLYGIEFGKHCDCEHDDHSDCCEDKSLVIHADKSDKSGARLLTAIFDSYKYFLVKAIPYNLFSVAKNQQFHSPSIIICDSSPPIYISFQVFRV
jgi:hypothetical protein